MPRNDQDPDRTLSAAEGLTTANRRLATALAELEHERDRFAELYDMAPFAFLTLDPVGLICDLNAEGERLLGVRSRVVGRRLHSFVEPGGHKRLNDHLRDCRRRSDPCSCELRLQRPEGPPMAVQLRSRPVGKAGRRFAAALVDMRERDRVALETERLLAAGREAEAASAAKDQFIAMLSHELRTPLTPVLAAVSALRDKGELPVALQPVHEMIHRNLSAEARLIDDLLDATRIARGKMSLERCPTDLHEAATDVVETLAAEVQGKGHRVLVALEAIQHHVLGDPVRLRQVLWNLLRNAVKFTPPGGLIELRSWNRQRAVVLEVRDNGRGFAPEGATRLFSPFEQGTGGAGGLGLGLAICRGLVELHGGQLTAASPGVGRGARFVMQLETVPAPQTGAQPPVVTARATAAANKPRILLVEDHVDTAELLLDLFGGAGYEVKGAASVGAALAVDLDAVELVVSDIGLPDGSGLDLMRQLALRANIKGIALTGYGTEADVRACREAGFSAHLTKPVDWPRLLAAVEKLTAERAR